jgi:16S rRNA (guanine527-N7)-methyltransferase
MPDRPIRVRAVMLPDPDPALRLEAACTALGLATDRDTLLRLVAYADALNRWNKVYNLTAVRDPAEVYRLHLIDSLSLVPALRRHAASAGGGPLRILDVGSGAGLPGAVVAAVCHGFDVTCVDAVAKKVAFVRQAAAEIGLTNLRAVHARVESLGAGPHYSVITSRAFSSLADLVGLTRHLLSVPGGVWVAMKGVHPTEEIEALPDDIDMFHVEHLDVPGLDAQRCLVWMRPLA